MDKKSKAALTGLIMVSVAIVLSPSARAMRARGASLPVVVHFTAPSTCQISFTGQTFILPDDQERMVAAFRELRKHWRALSIAATAETPYKCIGGAIYLAQSSGFEKVRFEAAGHIGAMSQLASSQRSVAPQRLR